MKPLPIIICACVLLYALPTDLAVGLLLGGGVLAGLVSAVGGGRH